MCLYSVVVPVYNSEHTLQELYTRLEKVFRETIKEEFELILVDDGSRDRSFAVMQELREKDPLLSSHYPGDRNLRRSVHTCS